MTRLTRANMLRKAEELKNWGKWGPEDELGVLNYITPPNVTGLDVPQGSLRSLIACRTNIMS
jgi:hypothetical protein